MRVIHLADLHFLRERYEEAAASIRTVCSDIDRNGADLVVVAGDTWDGPVQNTAGARFADFLALVRELANRAPVVMIYGTPSHDTEGSLEVFEQIEARFGIEILRPGIPYGLTASRTILALEHEEPVAGDKLAALLFGVPEPNKKWLLANAGAMGKDQADEAARSAMRALFLGLGGMRKEHAELPCVLLYHGQVRGAKTATGYTAESGLAVTRDDLVAVGADYIALGDIHEPQQIPGVPAYYPGSIYPINWGETHKAGANVVEIRAASTGDLFAGSSNDVVVSRLEFPHPQRMKIAHTYGQVWTGCVVGKQVWVETTVTKDEAQLCDTDALLDKLMADGALPGSRVTLNVLPTETVRAGEIAEKATLRDKVTVWAENSSIATTESLLSKADELERETASAGAVGSGAHIRYTRLRLRGAIGIYKKSRKDEIDLDLEVLGAGVLAFASPNGAGKTTILENMHPWPCMLTREGVLKDHFRLKDSCRDLYFVDDRTGWRYRALITIRADIASGGAEYFLYCDKGQGYEPLPGINGRKEPYEEAVGHLFGSLEMYLRTAFSSQRPSKYAPDLSEATKGQRKALFAELSGIDYLEGYKAAAKARADQIEEEARDLRALVDLGRSVALEIDEITERIGQAKRRGAAAAESMRVSAARGLELKDQHAAAVEREQYYAGRATRRDTITQELRELAQEIAEAEKAIAGFQAAAKGRGAAEEKLETIKALKAEGDALRAEKAGVDERNRKTIEEANRAQAEINQRRRAAQAELDAARRALANTERELAAVLGRLSAPIEEHCPTCGQILPEDKRAELAAARELLDATRRRLESASVERQDAVALVESRVAAIIDPPSAELEPFDNQARLTELERELEWADPDALQATIRKADEADVRISEARRRIDAANKSRDYREAELEELIAELERQPAAIQARRDAEDALEAERIIFQEASREEGAALAAIAAEERALEAATKRKAESDQAETKLAALAPALADWRLLEKACGADGIQALELDALAPGIAAVANRLLAASGNTGRIEFRTTRIGGKGSKAKQIEDFLVVYIDEAGEEQEIATLSGGESVWIRKALYDAFAVIRAQNTGVQFLTVFLDEADGALDPDARMRYLRMLETAHDEAGRYQTIIVTHSTELQAMVSQTINVAALGPRDSVEGVAA